MAYGEDGKNIEDIPRQRRPSPTERVQEKEIDRFDEGKYDSAHLFKFRIQSHFVSSISLLIKVLFVHKH